MTKLYKLAILIPSHKPGDYFADCINSIRRQSMDKTLFKVYVALNGAREPYESSVKMLLSQSGLNFEYFYIKEASVSKARNKLLEISSEEFITFLDDDDMISENYLSGLYKNRGSNTIVSANVSEFESDMQPIPNYVGRFVISQKSNYFKSLFKCRRLLSSSCAKLIPRKVIDNIRFDESLRLGEDSYFMVCIAPKIYAVRIVDDCFYYVNKRTNSVSRSYERKINQITRSLTLIVKFCRLLFVKRYLKSYPLILSRVFAVMKKLVS